MTTKVWSAVAIAVGLSMVACGGGTVTTERATVHVEPERRDPEPAPVACVEEWVHMPVHIGFPTGGTEIDAQNRLILQEIVRTASSRDDIRRVRAEGHTDSCGREANNMALSEARATSVAMELVAMGVPREILETQGYGSTVPIADESCDGARLSAAANRRVEFSILGCRQGTY